MGRNQTRWQFSKYKYDIPVLHINNKYWMKHRLTKQDAIQGLQDATNGKFNKPNLGEPDAGEMERRQEERSSSEDSPNPPCHE